MAACDAAGLGLAHANIREKIVASSPTEREISFRNSARKYVLKVIAEHFRELFCPSDFLEPFVDASE